MTWRILVFESHSDLLSLLLVTKSLHINLELWTFIIMFSPSAGCCLMEIMKIQLTSWSMWYSFGIKCLCSLLCCTLVKPLSLPLPLPCHYYLLPAPLRSLSRQIKWFSQPLSSSSSRQQSAILHFENCNLRTFKVLIISCATQLPYVKCQNK